MTQFNSDTREEERTLARHRWEYNIKLDLKDTGRD
jgi:hypothetical protein